MASAFEKCLIDPDRLQWGINRRAPDWVLQRVRPSQSPEPIRFSREHLPFRQLNLSLDTFVYGTPHDHPRPKLQRRLVPAPRSAAPAKERAKDAQAPLANGQR